MLLELVQVGDHGQRRVFVLLALGQLQQLGRFRQPIKDGGDATDSLLQLGTLAAEVLRVFGIVPDVRVLQLPGYFFQAFFLDVVVKDTP